MENKRKNEIIKNYINEKGWGSAHNKICKEMRRNENLRKSLFEKFENKEIEADDYFELSDELVDIYNVLEINKKFFNSIKQLPEDIRGKYFINIDALDEKEASITCRALLR
jgi:hypothetical protein